MRTENILIDFVFCHESFLILVSHLLRVMNRHTSKNDLHDLLGDSFPIEEIDGIIQEALFRFQRESRVKKKVRTKNVRSFFLTRPQFFSNP